jgi:hypothetical protein
MARESLNQYDPPQKMRPMTRPMMAPLPPPIRLPTTTSRPPRAARRT